MKVLKKIPTELDQFEGDLVVAIIGEDERPLKSTNAWLDWRLYGTLTELILRGQFTGQMGEKCLLPTYGKFNFDRILMMGGGSLLNDAVYPTSEQGRETWIKIGNLVDETLRSLKVDKIGLSLPRFELIDQERALFQHLEASSLRADASLFVARAAQNFSPAGFSL